MELARTLLGMPQPQCQATEDAQAFMRRMAALEINACPHCRKGRLCLVQLLPPQAVIAPHRAAVCGGPP